MSSPADSLLGSRSRAIKKIEWKSSADSLLGDPKKTSRREKKNRMSLFLGIFARREKMSQERRMDEMQECQDLWHSEKKGGRKNSAEFC
jgi:hypothetical protein